MFMSSGYSLEFSVSNPICTFAFLPMTISMTPIDPLKPDYQPGAYQIPYLSFRLL